MAACASLLGCLPDAGPRPLRQMRMAYTLAAAAGLEVHATLPQHAGSLRLAARMAALLAWRAEQEGDKVGGCIFSEQGTLEVKPGRGRKAVLRWLDRLVEQAAQRTKPSHPRFGGDIARPLPGTELVGEGATPPEMRLREWIYVDFDGKPLAAADLATAPAARMTHLMPFVLRVVMDQRRLDPLLVDLARSPVPIDVREVRINPGAARGAGEGGQAEASGGRTHDVIVELRGTVGLATPPTAAGVGLEPAAPPAAAAGGPGPRDAFTDRVGTPLPPRSEAA